MEDIKKLGFAAITLTLTAAIFWGFIFVTSPDAPAPGTTADSTTTEIQFDSLKMDTIEGDTAK